MILLFLVDFFYTSPTGSGLHIASRNWDDAPISGVLAFQAHGTSSQVLVFEPFRLMGWWSGFGVLAFQAPGMAQYMVCVMNQSRLKAGKIKARRTAPCFGDTLYYIRLKA